MNDLRTGLSYGDVLLVPQRSPVDSRSDVDLSTRLTPSVELASPLVSAAAMDTVTEAELAIELARAAAGWVCFTASSLSTSRRRRLNR